MAHIVVFVDLRDGQPTSPTRFALAEARRVARELGATVYALAAVTSSESADALGSTLGAAGADKILACSDVAFAGAPTDERLGRLLVQVAERLRPRLFLFPAGAAGLCLAPALAVRTGAAYMPRAALGCVPGEQGRTHLEVRRWRGAQDGWRVLSLTASDVCVVATLPARAGGLANGRVVDVQLVSRPAAEPPRIEDTRGEPVQEIPPIVVFVGADRSLAGVNADHIAVGTAGPSAAPALVVLAAGTAAEKATFLRQLRLAPDTQVILASGRATEAPSSLVTAIWRRDKTRAITELRAALTERGA